MDFMFYINAVLLGIGLAMDAFSVSLANGLNEPKMKTNKMLLMSLIFGVFQTAMPLIGWVCVSYLVETFTAFSKYIPWIALILLLYIGGKMVIEGIQNKEGEEAPALTFQTLIIQGIATSIDALSVGFTIAGYSLFEAIIENIIIGAVTSIVCYVGIIIGKKFGTKLSSKATIVGGIILILIGIEIFVEGVIL